ncbi:hypothetical protein BAUCODRAFT_142356 [Baudoinia panamericana UAMH 10762]|uniref:Uncharacterized protein n=1 Tax=Baudoinia panamericana (strain UAMH 10762) TaxID=717646 RepID=M2LFH4_BAUPA|nr:uncharacterized protein BAUCODRAFT_142356 [Baudoinia panamericana UAMH 10762]EMC92792.1 hypothetical protein BAUCODRAFT_142356 [Baudoinia panamericana UAMH 10762]
MRTTDDGQHRRPFPKRSRSPRDDHDVKRRRSRSPYRHSKHHRSPPADDIRLPFGVHLLHKRDLSAYTALFAEYLDINKRIDIERLDEYELKGRWKSFLGKWNRGELSKGWYDPEAKRRADARHTVGPAVPTLQDLQVRQEMVKEDLQLLATDRRNERQQERKAQKERLKELAPRAQPGSKERQIERKRETAAANRAFRDAKESGDAEVGEGELMGDAGLDSYKAKLKAMERQKNEREIRKEEVLRARAAEREERLAVHRAKEEKTVQMLKELARQRFG